MTGATLVVRSAKSSLRFDDGVASARVRQIEPVENGLVVATARFFSDVAGETPADPDTVTFRVREPGQTDDVTYVVGTDSEATARSTGVFDLRLVPDANGVWWFRCDGAGTVDDGVEASLYVRATAFDATPGPD